MLTGWENTREFDHFLCWFFFERVWLLKCSLELDTFLEIFLIYHSYNMLFLTAYNKLALLTLNLSYGVICDHLFISE